MSTEHNSALSSLPIRQGIAVTGSVNQLGEVQVIGGATASHPPTITVTGTTTGAADAYRRESR